jgi:hypothetical protein
MWSLPLLREVLAEVIGATINGYLARRRAIEDEAQSLNMWRGTRDSLDSVLSPGLDFAFPVSR